MATRRAFLPRLVHLALVAALVLTATAASAAEAVKVRAWPHKGFGRLVFDWKAPVKYTASVAGTTLTVRFERPMTVQLGIVGRQLGDYISSIEAGRDGHSVTATLTRPFRLRDFVSEGNSIALDLIPRKAPSGGDRAKPAAAREIKVRTGEHTGFGRFVFEWGGPVGYRVGRENNAVTIQFDRPGKVNLAKLRQDLPPPVTAVVDRSGKSGLAIGLVVPPGSRLRHYRTGTQVIVDVLSDKAAPARPRQEAPSAEPAPPPAPSADRAPTRLLPEKHAAAKNAPAEVTKKGDRPDRNRARAKPRIDGPLVSIDVVRRSEGLNVRFNWREPVGVAVFRRENQLWAVFDSPARMALGALRTRAGGWIEQAEQVPQKGVAAIRLTVDQEASFRVRRERTIWVLELGRRLPFKGRLIDVVSEPDAPGGGRIVLPVHNASKPIAVADPQVGDVIQVVPMRGQVMGLPLGRRTVDVALLPSASGIAVRPISENVHLRVLPKGVVITRDGGLRLSSHEDLSRPRVRETSKRLLDFGNWAKGPDPDAVVSRQMLHQRVVNAPAVQRNIERLRLARFYVAHDLGAEAVGVLEAMGRADKSVRATRGYRALIGVAHYLSGQYAAAKPYLDQPDLAGHVEIRPWRAGLAAARGDWKGAQALFTDLETVVDEYPPWLAARFRLLAIEASLALGDTHTALMRIESQQAAGAPSKSVSDRLDVLRGYYLRAVDKADDAEKLWNRVIAEGDRPARARASLALTNLKLDRGKLDKKGAIEALERLRFSWRGDVFEYDLLRRLAELYVEVGDYAAALSRLKQAATYFSDIEGVDSVARKMSEIFEKVFAGGAADKIQPVKALALFDQYRELTPAGKEGDAMIRRLADRLVSIDLIGEAIKLLDQQVRFRLKGQDKARVGAELASLHLIEHQPMKALETLRISTLTGLPAEMVVERGQLRARALADLGRHDEALAILDGDTSIQAERLRAGIYWDTKKWKQAAESFGILVNLENSAEGKKHVPALLLSRAVALEMAGETAALRRLGAKYKDEMAKSGYADAFRVLTSDLRPEGTDYRSIAANAGAVDVFEAFLTNYRRRFASNAQPPAIN